MPEEVELPSDTVVVRFSPTEPSSVLKKLKSSSRYYSTLEGAPSPAHWMSCFADVKRDGETAEDVVRRLVAVAGVNGINLAGNKYCWVARSDDLQALGVSFWKGADEHEAPEHYNLDVGTRLTPDRVAEVLAAFEGPERTSDP